MGVRPTTTTEGTVINPETGSEIEVEEDGDFTVTFEMTLPVENDKN